MPHRVPRKVLLLTALIVAVAFGAIHFPALHRRVQNLARPARTEEQARREVVQPPIATPTDVNVKAQIFWASGVSAGAMEPVEVELALSGDPVRRAKQLIHTLIMESPSPQRRTLPADVALLEFYLLADGTAVADFSDTLATATPSGILSEQTAVDSIARTLAANVEAIRRIKILIQGQDTDTLAGHLDLTGFFPVRSVPESPAPTASSGPPGKAVAIGLTPPQATGKLGRH